MSDERFVVVLRRSVGLYSTEVLFLCHGDTRRLDQYSIPLSYSRRDARRMLMDDAIVEVLILADTMALGGWTCAIESESRRSLARWEVGD